MVVVVVEEDEEVLAKGLLSLGDISCTMEVVIRCGMRL